MKDLYIRHKGTPKPCRFEDFIAHVLANLGDIQADRERVISCLSFLDARRQHPRIPMSPWSMPDGSIMQPSVECESFWNAVSKIWDESIQCHKEAMGLTKPQSEHQKEQVSQALEAIKEFQDLEVDELQTEADKLLSRNFEILAGGGLALREGASLTLQEGLEAVGLGVRRRDAAGRLTSATNLGLGDIVNAVEDKHGDVYTQVVETSGKTLKYIQQLKMTSRYFPPRKRAELDPEAVLTYSHYAGCCVKALTDSDRSKLIEIAVKRSSTKEAVGSDTIKQMAAELAKIPEAERADVLDLADAKMESTKEALNLIRHTVQVGGGDTNARKRFLYIGYPGYEWSEREYPWQHLTNDFSKELAMKADLVIRLVPQIQVMDGPDTFSDIPFTYISPEIIEGDPKHPEDIEYYADYHVVEQKGVYYATGTCRGIVTPTIPFEAATSLTEAVAALKKRYHLNEQNRDPKGRLWRIRSES